jgi:hypothetical protein
LRDALFQISTTRPRVRSPTIRSKRSTNTKRLHGRETITVDAFDKLYSGKLLIEAFEQFAPEEIKAKPAPRPPELAQTASSPPGLTHRPNNELVDEQAKRSNLPKPPLPKGAFIGKSSTLSGRIGYRACMLTMSITPGITNST